MSSTEQLIGKQVPYSSMETLPADGEHFARVALPDYTGKWLVLFSCPMDLAFVHPTELIAFSEHREAFRTAGAELLSVGMDSVYIHQTWQRNGLDGLGYPMATDQTLRVYVDYGVLLEEEGMVLRGLFLTDPGQKVRYSVIHDNNIGRNLKEMLRVLAVLKTGGLCVASWEVREENLRPDMTEHEVPMLMSTTFVRIYTVPGCSYCRSAKGLLRQDGISCEKINLAENKIGQAFMESHGYIGLPATVIGVEEIVGYNVLRIKAALSLSGANEVK